MIEEVRKVIEDVAIPVIGESPTLEQCIEVVHRLQGASAEDYRARLEAKKRKGELIRFNSFATWPTTAPRQRTHGNRPPLTPTMRPAE